MSEFSVPNKIQLPEPLTANLTFMDTHKKGYKTTIEIHFLFLPDILQLKSKAHSPSNSRMNLQQVHKIKITQLSRGGGKRLGVGGGAGGAAGGASRRRPPSARGTAPSPSSWAGGERAPFPPLPRPYLRGLRLRHNSRQDFWGEKETGKGARLTLDLPASRGRPAAALTPTRRSGDGPGGRGAAPPGAVAGGSRGAPRQTPRPGRAASPPPPAQLRGGRQRPGG